MVSAEDISWEPVIVEWIDAYTLGGSSSRKVADTYDLCRRRSIGFLIVEDEDRVTIAMEDDRDDVSGADAVNDCDTVTTIPRGMIERIIRLKAPARKR